MKGNLFAFFCKYKQMLINIKSFYNVILMSFGVG